jgi:hypothetical protein
MLILTSNNKQKDLSTKREFGCIEGKSSKLHAIGI